MKVDSRCAHVGRVSWIALAEAECRRQDHCRRASILTPLDPDLIAATLTEAPAHAPDLSRVAARAERIFRLHTPHAPGFCLVGAQIGLTEMEAACFGAPELSVTGNGLSLAAALTSCLAEAAEWLSQVERPGDITPPSGAPLIAEGWLAAALAGMTTRPDLVTGWSRRDCGPVALPADLVLRRVPERRRMAPIGPLGAGVAAGFDLPDAGERALLELVERDAAALWWLGGRVARPLAGTVLEDGVLRQLRGEAGGRETNLLDLTTELGIPVCAAWSCDAEGRGLAIGIAARLSGMAAANAALMELAQMELAAPLALRKAQERGPEALNDTDRRHLARASVPVDSLPALFPKGAPALEPGRSVLDAASLLEAQGCQTVSINLTRTGIGVPVVRAICPELQPFTTTTQTLRFAAACGEAAGQEPPAVSLF